MNELAAAIEEARGEVALAANEILPDRGDIIGPTFTDGGAAGDSVSLGTVASNVNVSYRGLGNGRQFVIGGEAYTASHELKMVRTQTTGLITPRHKFKVYARGKTPELVFENLFPVDDSKSPFLKLNATIVKQGYQQ